MHEKTIENYANLQRNKLILPNQISPKFKRKKIKNVITNYR